MNNIRMIQSEEKSHFKLSQMEERSRKASIHETIVTRPRQLVRKWPKQYLVTAIDTAPYCSGGRSSI